MRIRLYIFFEKYTSFIYNDKRNLLFCSMGVTKNKLLYQKKWDHTLWGCEKRYVLLPEGTILGVIIVSSSKVPISIGNALCLSAI